MKKNFFSALILFVLILTLLVPAGSVRAISATTTVDSTGDVGSYSSIAIRSNGLPVISYYDQTNGDLKLAVCSNEACTSKTITTIDSTGDAGRHNSLVLNGSGFPVISYIDGNNKLKVAICTNLLCTTKTSTVVDNSNVFSYTSLALNSSGVPVISYFESVAFDLKLAVCGNTTCSAGNTLTTIDSAGNVGSYNSLTLSVSDFPIISYYDQANQDLKVAACGDTICSSGNTVTVVDSTGIIGQYGSSLKLNASGFPVISYHDGTNGTLKVATCGNAACSTGNALTVVDSPLGTAVGRNSSLALNSSGYPLISYYDTSNANLKLAACGNADCTSGNTIIVLDSAGNVGLNTSVGLNAGGFPIISYYDNTNADLKVAIRDDLVAPIVTSFTLKNPASSPTNANTLTFLATFSEPVTGVSTADFSTFCGCTATVSNVTQLTTSTYDVTLSGGNLASWNGLVGLNLAGLPTTITDLAGNSLVGIGGEPATDQIYMVDNTAPGIQAFLPQSPSSTPTNADTLTFRATFSEAVAGVNMADFTANTSSTATVTNVAQVDPATYDVTISGGNLAGFNGTVNLNLSSTPTITDLAGNSLPGGDPALDQSYTVDNTAPSLTSFTYSNPPNGSTNADMLTFLATFNEPMTGINSADFTLTTTSTATITNVSNSDGTGMLFLVTVSGGNLAGFNGTVNLNLSVTPTITDFAGNALPAGEPATDQTYTVVNAPPTVLSFTRYNPVNSLTYFNNLEFLVTFSEDVKNVDTGDFTANTSSTATIFSASQLTPSTYVVTISGGNLATFNGTVNLNLDPAANIASLFNNPLTIAEPPIDETYTVEHIQPSVLSFKRQNPVTSTTSTDTLIFRAIFSEAVTNMIPADFFVNGGSYAAVTNITQVTPTTYDLTVSGGNLPGFNGAISLNVPVSSTIKDIAGNTLLIAEPPVDEAYTMTNPASTWVVTKLADTNDSICNADCSLREAVSVASNGDFIVFAPALTGTITLSGTGIYIDKSITINGPGISSLTIDGNNTSRIFEIPYDSDYTISISGMTLTKGNTSSSGAAIESSGILNIDSVNFTNNHATGIYSGGGAIFTNGTLTINNSTFNNNSASYYGGAIAGDFGAMITITNSVLENNQTPGTVGVPYSSGGAITVLSDIVPASQSHLSLDHVTVENNSTAYSGGGLDIRDNAVVTISNSTISGNSTSLPDSYGGGFEFSLSVSATFNNVTISGNTTDREGAGIHGGSSGTFNMNNVTIANNVVTSAVNGTGGGIHIAGVLNIKNSIIANNDAASGKDCYKHPAATFNSQGNNLVEFDSYCGISGDTTGNITGVDPALGSLSKHGGDTEILPLLSSSPAIDAGNDATCLTTDQRGFPRPQGEHCDMGAFETGAASWVVTKLADTNDNICDSDCSLREAITLALDADKISFAPALNNGTITLDAGLGALSINNNIHINGLGADKLAVSGNDLVRVFIIVQDKIVNISNLTITHGYVFNDGGGGIVNDGGNLTLDHVVVANNQTAFTLPSLGNGGGIYSYGTLTVKNSKIAHNTSNQGGGIYNAAGSNFSLIDTVVEHNSSASGGGLYLGNPPALPGGAISLTRVSMTNNSATVSGGGLFLGSSAVITNSVIANNTASNGLGAGAGGGITISETGGADSPITVSLTNVTVSGNTAFGQGGGVNVSLQQAADSVTFTNVTIADNQRIILPGPPAVNGGGGLFTSGSEYLNIKNSIIAGNSSIVGGADCEGTLNSLDYNLIQNTTSCTINGTTTHNVTGVSANLGPLAANGGSLLTMKLIYGSPAIDSADNAACPATDQRGIARPQGAGCDMGAFEAYISILFSSSAANDGWALESTEFSNLASTKNNTSFLRIGDDIKNKQYRSLLYFDTASLPNNAVVTRVVLKVKSAGIAGTNPFTTHGDLVADIKKGIFGLSPLEITDFNAAAAPINSAGIFSDIGAGWYQLTLSPANFQYINLNGVTQFRLRFSKDDDNDKIADFISFYSGEDASNPPQLLIEYTAP